MGNEVLLAKDDKKEEKKKGDTRVASFHVNITVRGGEGNIIKFVEAAEDMDRFLEITSVTISASDTKTKAKKQTGLIATINANSYYFKESGGK